MLFNRSVRFVIVFGFVFEKVRYFLVVSQIMSHYSSGDVLIRIHDLDTHVIC